MVQVSLKKEFEAYALKESYNEIIRVLGKEPLCGDDFADALIHFRKKKDARYDAICGILENLTEAHFFDRFRFLLINYETKVRFESDENRIGVLSEMMEYSYLREYVVELACLYLRNGEKAKARRLVMNSASSFDVFEEKEVLLGDIRDGTENYKQFLPANVKAKAPKPVIPAPGAEKPKVPQSTLKKAVPKKTDADAREKPDQRKLVALRFKSDADEGNYPEFIRQKFEENHLVGMKQVKEQLAKLYKTLLIEHMRQEKLGIADTNKKGLNFILYGNPGTGKTSVARLIGEILYQMGLVEENAMIETDRSGLVDSVIGGTEQKTQAVLESARGKTLFIDEAYTLYDESSDRDFGKIAIDLLLKDIEDHRGEYCVILAGYKKQMDNMIKKANKGFASRFDIKIEIPDYDAADLLNIIIKMAEAKNYYIDVNAKNAILDRIDREKIDETFDNARFMRRLLDFAIGKQSERLAELNRMPTDDELCFLQKEDFLEDGYREEENVDYVAQLNKLIGLESVKREVAELVSAATVMAEQKKRGIKTAGVGTLHLAFVGNPGTGKTTVARLLGKIYNQLGLLKRKDVFVESQRSQLVGRYQGETAIKVTDSVNSALGGVLFIDEAYNLVNGEHDTFGMEAVNTLIAEMENNRANVAIIIAGYTKEINEFMDANPGIRSRISRVLEFEDYTVDEMVDIFLLDIKKRGLDVSGIPRETIYRFIDSKCHVKDFGNGRGVRNLSDKVVRQHNNRLTKMKNLSSVSDRDFISLTEEDFCID